MAKVTDVVGLYLAPPERAIVLSVDEKTQIQALDRTQPMLPLRPGQVERHTHDYKRNGTLSLFAALEVATGQVTGQTRERHTGDDFLAFLRLLARTYRTGEVHVVLDNVSTHKTPDVEAWLRRHKRFTFHFTPTASCATSSPTFVRREIRWRRGDPDSEIAYRLSARSADEGSASTRMRSSIASPEPGRPRR